MPVDQELQLSLLTLFDHSVLVVWKGPKLEDIKDCDVMHHAINSTILEETVEQMMPLDYTMEVDDLQPLTAYQLQVVCHTKHNVKFSSKHFNFTTGRHAQPVKGAVFELLETVVIILVQVSCRAIFIIMLTAGEGCTVRPAISHPVSVPGTQSSLASTKLPVLQKKMSTSTSSLDLVLGVLFACLGVSVMLTLAYFLLKKYRRHQRIRRFLQYRYGCIVCVS